MYGSRSRSTSALNSLASRVGDGPGALGSASPSTCGDRLHLADGRREERLVGVGERADRHGDFFALDVELATELEHAAHASRRAGSRSTRVACAARRRCTTNTLEPVASQSSSRVFGKMASPAPRSCAYASARTFSAYEIVFSPAVAPRSLRAHGTTTTVIVGATDDDLARGDDDRRARVAALRAERLHARR